MKVYSKLFALGAVLMLSTAFASADTLTLGSWATGQPNPGTSNTAMNFAGFQAIPQPFVPPAPPILPQGGTASTFFLDPSTIWNPALANSTWVGVAPTAGPVGTVNPAYGFYTFPTQFTATRISSGFFYLIPPYTT